MLTKKWYDHPRAELNFIKEIKSMNICDQKLKFTYQYDFDTNGNKNIPLL